ncbi:MAG TPA: hypothetical protein VND65_01040 [Candidatus Binatia bacterium]|nr:hypothetical protein [Candidatus Binatia bacterium]
MTRKRRWLAALTSFVFVCSLCAPAQSAWERTFPQSKTAVEKALKELQPALGGRLPVLDGFARPGETPLDRYQRGYYQSKIIVTATPSGGCVVRVTTQVTAWYADPNPSKSGYRLLPSNGRLEADLLDQLADQVAAGQPNAPSAAPAASTPAASAPPPAVREQPHPVPQSTVAQTGPQTPTPKSRAPSTQAANEPGISAPVPQFPEGSGKLSPSLAENLAQPAAGSSKQTKLTEGASEALRTEAQNLEEILKSQANPQNIVAVKKSGTPVVETPSLTAKTLFLASTHDEFEMLDFTSDWVHVRISGLSRGWIWRNSLEMPGNIADNEASAPAPTPVAAELFRVSREETAQFPGDWAPLRGKNVKIVSVESISDAQKDTAQQRLAYAKSILDKDYPELSQRTQQLAGIVVIFDSIDGGMIAATFPTLQQWKAGKLSDAALWHECFFDPPETFGPSGAHSSGAVASPAPQEAPAGSNLQ